MLPRTIFTRRIRPYNSGRVRCADDGHEVDDFAHAVGREETCHQDVGIGPIDLLVGLLPARLGQIRKLPPFWSSRIAPKTLGESNCGKQNQSTEPFLPISVTVCRLPDNPVVFDWLVGHVKVGGRGEAPRLSGWEPRGRN